MLRELHLRNTGPSPQLDAAFAERLNVFTGDNGLGKSFLLDVTWWALTQLWVGHPAAPHRPLPRPANNEPSISWKLGDPVLSVERLYDFVEQAWYLRHAHEPPNPSAHPLVVYARVDGGVAVWDPLRNRRETREREGMPQTASIFNFTREQVWNGLHDANDRQVCNGLVQDWVLWQLLSERPGRDSPFRMLSQVLRALSPAPDELLVPGEPVRVFRGDTTEYPTLVFSHGVVPVIHASAGMQRILTIAYVLTWAWYEHQRAAELARTGPATEIVFLIDEVEAHLHPQWQRRILPALLRVLGELKQDMRVQVMATTHSPLVLASLEPHFEPDHDRLFHFGLEDGLVTLREEPWAREGNVDDWLKSDTFGLRQAHSIEAEQAIEAAKAWIRGEHGELSPGLDSEAAIEAALHASLPADDEFWPRWRVHVHRPKAP